MPNDSSAIVQKLWNYCHVLRDDGISYGDYVEQLTYLLFLKMADEQTKPPFRKESVIPAGTRLEKFSRQRGDLTLKRTTAISSTSWHWRAAR